MNEINESRRTEKSRAGRDIFGKNPYFFGYELFHCIVLRSEFLHEFFADTIILRSRKNPFYLFTLHFPVFQLYRHINIRHHRRIACRIDNQYRISCHIRNLFAFARMIMPHQYHIKSGNILRNAQRCIFIIFTRH